jgi:hypothetical protein
MIDMPSPTMKFWLRAVPFQLWMVLKEGAAPAGREESPRCRADIAARVYWLSDEFLTCVLEALQLVGAEVAAVDSSCSTADSLRGRCCCSGP